MRSTDGGANWLFAQPQPTINTINSIALGNSRTTFAVGQFGSILRSYQPLSALSTSRRAIHFDSVQVLSCDSVQFSAVNAGDTAVQILDISVNGVDSGSFSVTYGATMPVTLLKGQSLPISVRFCSTDTGYRAIVISISNSSSSPFLNILADGYAGQVNYTVTDSLNFGMVAVADFNDVRDTVYSSGTISLLLKSLHITGPDSAMFNYNGTFQPVSLFRGESFPMRFVFSPTAAGPRTAIAEFATNAGQPLRLFLHGNDGTQGVGESATSLLPITSLSVAPMPLRDAGTIAVATQLRGPATLTLSDLLGRTVWMRHIVLDGNETQMPLTADVHDGMYLLTLSSAGGLTAQPIVVLR